MNTRERNKKERIAQLIKLIGAQKEIDKNGLISILIVNYAISRKIALEEINAVIEFLKNNESENPGRADESGEKEV